MASEPVIGIVVNCEAASLPSSEHVEELRAEALKLLESGAPNAAEVAQNILGQATRIEERRVELGPVETKVELEGEALEQYELDQEEGARLQVEQRRAERNARLLASDWTQVPDSPISTGERERWRVYRQELRDLDFDSDPDWPEAPK